MTRTLKNIALIIAIALLIGASTTFIAELKNKSEKEEAPTVEENETPVENVIGGTQGFTTDFSTMSLVEYSTDQMRLVNENGAQNPSQLFCENGYGEITLDNGVLNYLCTQSGASTTYPKFKLKPLESGKLYLEQFKVLTIDFDISYMVDVESEYNKPFRALFNVRSDTLGSTVTDNTLYYDFITDGSGFGSAHYTFIYFDKGEGFVSGVFVYKDGVFQRSIRDFITEAYDASDFYVACFNLELPRTLGDMVSIDNIEYHYFEEDYDGPINTIYSQPFLSLTKNKDSVLYTGE